MAEPKIRFKQDDGSNYPEWKELTLGDIATRVTRKNSKGETDRPLTIASIEGLVDQRTYFGKTIASKDMSGYFLLKNGEFAYNKSYSAGYDYGSIKRLDKYDMGALSTLYICFALNEGENSDFYNCYFNSLSWYSQMPQICAEGARNHGLLNVSPNDFFKINLCVPSSKEEQQKITDFLSSVDEVIATSEQEITNLETQKKAVMKKIFSQEVRFKKADGTVFPEWEEKTLGEVCEPLQYGMNTAASEYDGQNKYIRITDIDDSTHMYMKDNIVSPAGELSDKYLVRKGDILLARTGASTGKSYLYKEEDGRLYFAGFLIRAHVKDGYDDFFIYSQTLTYAYERWVKLTSQRSGQPGINSEEYSSYVLHIPCLEEQHLIADFLSNFDEAIQAAKKELELWKQLKKGLLQQLFV